MALQQGQKRPAGLLIKLAQAIVFGLDVELPVFRLVHHHCHCSASIDDAFVAAAAPPELLDPAKCLFKSTSRSAAAPVNPPRLVPTNKCLARINKSSVPCSRD